MNECKGWKSPVLVLVRRLLAKNLTTKTPRGRKDGSNGERRIGTSERREGSTDLQIGLSGAIPRDGAIGDIVVNVVHIGWKTLIF